MNQLPYEFHVTVTPHERNPDEFREICAAIGVKAIVLDLGVNRGIELSDYMTSSTQMLHADRDAAQELERIAREMKSAGLNVVRRKIETAPWHPQAPQVEGEAMPEGSYFEAHLGVLVGEESVAVFRSDLQDEDATKDLHLSRNAFKQASDGRVVMMATLRDYDSPYIDFAERVARAQQSIEAMGLSLDKAPITEFALYDSNAHHDDAWMGV